MTDISELKAATGQVEKAIEALNETVSRARALGLRVRINRVPVKSPARDGLSDHFTAEVSYVMNSGGPELKILRAND